MNTIEQLGIVALLAWLIQLALAYRQARLFYRRISSLRKLGRCATGLAGGKYRARVYVVLVAHPVTHLIIKAEQLRGLTVFASIKPLPQLEGYSLDALLATPAPSIQGVKPPVIEAARSAAEAIQKSFDKSTSASLSQTEAIAVEQSTTPSATVVS
jgi:DNA-binding transcriptional regulator of glucitol operon